MSSPKITFEEFMIDEDREGEEKKEEELEEEMMIEFLRKQEEEKTLGQQEEGGISKYLGKRKRENEFGIGTEEPNQKRRRFLEGCIKAKGNEDIKKVQELTQTQNTKDELKEKSLQEPLVKNNPPLQKQIILGQSIWKKVDHDVIVIEESNNTEQVEAVQQNEKTEDFLKNTPILSELDSNSRTRISAAINRIIYLYGEIAEWGSENIMQEFPQQQDKPKLKRELVQYWFALCFSPDNMSKLEEFKHIVDGVRYFTMNTRYPRSGLFQYNVQYADMIKRWWYLDMELPVDLQPHHSYKYHNQPHWNFACASGHFDPLFDALLPMKKLFHGMYSFFLHKKHSPEQTVEMMKQISVFCKGKIH